MKAGRFELEALSDGTFRLDGGAMYGVVPRVLWERQAPPDDKNRIELALGVLFIRTPQGKNVLVDTGLSDKYDRDPKFLKLYGVTRRETLWDQLKARGLGPNDIHLVINTHLHFDHAGGNTVYDGERLVPAFPKARYIVQKTEWEDAHAPHERNRASYLSENFAVLGERKLVDLVEGEFEIEPGLKVLLSGGHTRGHQCVLVEDGGQGALFLGDLIPTRSHVALPWIMGYDLFPVDSLESKRSLLGRAKEKDWMLLFQHDPGKRAGYLRTVNGREVVEAA